MTYDLANIPADIPLVSTVHPLGVELIYPSGFCMVGHPDENNSTPEKAILLCADQNLPRDGSFFSLTATVSAADMAYCLGHEHLAKDDGMVDIVFPLVRYETRPRRQFVAHPIPRSEPQTFYRMTMRQLKNAAAPDLTLEG